MPITKKITSKAASEGGYNCVNFVPARLHVCKNNCQIEYGAYCAASGRLERVRVRVNKIIKQYKTKREAMQHIAAICEHINAKLRLGESPFVDISDNARLYEKLSAVIDRYINDRSKELRPASVKMYRSSMARFLAFVERLKPDAAMCDVTRSVVVRFFDSVSDTGIKNKSYNNIIRYCTAFGTWCVGKMYLPDNYFLRVKTKTKEAKERTTIDKDTRAKISEWLSKHDKRLLLMSRLVYDSLLRPKEALMLTADNIDEQKMVITVPGDVAKNHHTRQTLLSPDALLLIKELGYVGKYLFGDRLTSMQAHFDTKWVQMRKSLDLPNTIKLYSLRDSRITELLRAGVPPVTVMQLADHSSLAITSIYAKHKDDKLFDKIRSADVEF